MRSFPHSCRFWYKHNWPRSQGHFHSASPLPVTLVKPLHIRVLWSFDNLDINRLPWADFCEPGYFPVLHFAISLTGGNVGGPYPLPGSFTLGGGKQRAERPTQHLILELSRHVYAEAAGFGSTRSRLLLGTTWWWFDSPG